jgi:hypothetical protein
MADGQLTISGEPGVPALCKCCARHSPTIHLFEFHHVWPLGEKGPDKRENTVIICPNTHTIVHFLFNKAFQLNGVWWFPPGGGPFARNIVRAGLEYRAGNATVGSMHGYPSLELWRKR